MNPFETETMADLCLRQGHRDEALTIYRRLLARTADEATKERINRNIAAIARETTPSGTPPIGAPAAEEEKDGGLPPLQTPGVRTRWAGDGLTIEWRLPLETETPALEVLLVTRGPTGVVTETRAIDLNANRGRITLTVTGLHLARAAAGFRSGGSFVPIARD
jgi:hypothetical protein